MENLYKKPDLLHLLSDMLAVYISCISEIENVKKPLHFVYPSGKPMFIRQRTLAEYPIFRVAKGSQ